MLLAPNYLTGSDNVPAGMTNVKQPGGSLTAAVGDGKTDDTSAIKAIVKHVEGSTNNKVFFPRGEYLVGGDIAISGSVKLHGTQSGIAVIKASTPYAIKIHNASPVSSVSLQLQPNNGDELYCENVAHSDEEDDFEPSDDKMVMTMILMTRKRRKMMMIRILLPKLLALLM